MPVREEIRAFLQLGPLPASDALDEEAVGRAQAHLERIEKPVNDVEAVALLAAFGPDDCFGLAWTLLHLVESCPAALDRTLIKERPAPSDNEWIRRLWDRAHRG